MTLPRILKVVWGDQEGYVCISTLKRPGGSWYDHMFKWPEEKKDISKLIQEYQDDHEIYWAPMVFSKRRRKEEYSTDSSCLWADLDPISPNKCQIKPSIAWESSPGRYQAIWLLDSPITPPDHDELNKRMTYATGADKSGWDLTQVLRLPGTTNHKYVEKPTVKMLWMNRTYYNPQDIADTLPDVGVNKLTELDSVDIEVDELRELIWPYRRILGTKLWQLLFAPSSLVDEEDRSERLWELECRLLEAGIPVAEVIKIVKACPWNKFKDRADEDKRILLEVLKADKQTRKSPIITPDDAIMPWVSYSQFMGKKMVNPGWMIEGIWANNSHGMIAGEPKTYKSVIATEIAISVASGYPMWDAFKVNKTGPVLIVQEENSEWILQDRIAKIAYSKGLLKGRVKIPNKASGKIFIEFPPELPIRICNGYGFDLTLVDDREALTEEIDRVGPALVILDPLYLMLGALDENSAQSLRETLAWLIRIKDDYGTAIMLLHHWNKGGGSARGGQRMLGSTTLHAWVESALYTSLRDPESKEVTIEREFRGFSKPPNLIANINMSDPGKDPYYEVKIKRSTELVKKGDEADVLSFLVTHGSLSINELCAAVGYTSPGMKKVMNKFEDNGWVTVEKGVKGRGKGSIYQITPKGRIYYTDLNKAEGSEDNG